MLVSEEELTVEIGQIDGIKVDNVHFTETSEDEVLEQLTADTSSANHQHARLLSSSVQFTPILVPALHL
jgi:hypothetical protein